MAVLKQSTIKMKISVAPVKLGGDLLLQMVDPPLDAEHAVGRLIYVPKSLWPDIANADYAGYVGKIMKMDKRSKIVEIKFHDGKQYVMLDTVMSVARPVS